jgi:hypothetical protein
MVGAGQPQRLGDPQAAAVKQCHYRDVARLLPVAAGLLANGFHHVAGAVLRQRPGQGAAVFRAARRQDHGRLDAFAVGRPAGEGLYRRQRPCQRSRAHAAVAFRRHPGAQIRRIGLKNRLHRLCAAAMIGQERQPAQHIVPVGLHRMRGCAIKRGKPGKPVGQRRPQLRRQGQRSGHESQRRIARSNTPPKKARRSVPCVGLN